MEEFISSFKRKFNLHHMWEDLDILTPNIIITSPLKLFCSLSTWAALYIF